MYKCQLIYPSGPGTVFWKFGKLDVLKVICFYFFYCNVSLSPCRKFWSLYLGMATGLGPVLYQFRRGWNRYWNKSQHTKWALEKKILQPLLRGAQTRGLSVTSLMTTGLQFRLLHLWTLLITVSVPRSGAWEVWQPVSVIRGAHQVRTQHVALPVLHCAGQCQGLHRVHWAWELRPFHD